jgi:hypothetical protein
VLLISNAYKQVTMSFFSLLGMTPCSPSDAHNPLYCVLGAREDCCESGVGRITIPLWDINKRQESGSSSGVFDSGYDYYSTLRTTSTTTRSTTGVTWTIAGETSSQAPSPSDVPSLPTTSTTRDTITSSPTGGPEPLATNISAVDEQVPSPSSGLSPGAKAGIGAGVAVAVLLIIGLGAAASIFYRRSKQLGVQNNDDDTTRDSGVADFANDRLIPEMDATHSERPAELEDIVLSELLSSFFSKTAPPCRKTDGGMKGNIHEMEA